MLNQKAPKWAQDLEDIRGRRDQLLQGQDALDERQQELYQKAVARVVGENLDVVLSALDVYFQGIAVHDKIYQLLLRIVSTFPRPWGHVKKRQALEEAERFLGTGECVNCHKVLPRDQLVHSSEFYCWRHKVGLWCWKCIAKKEPERVG